MSRWRRRPKHEKVGICLVQEMQRLSNALNNIPNADRPQYVMEWVQEQRDKGIDHEVLDNLEHGSRHAEKLWKLGGIISPNML
ncbi:MAG: hypothetical protein PHU95_02205, partial [Candidatus Thermoplasmatota archaeon]|nr:hypothetical protein [Candidatus Thermoplasmatota archaeon]